MCSVLSPIQEALKYAAHSSFEFLVSMPRLVPPGYEIATIDIKNLYPSINNEHLLQILSSEVFAHYGQNHTARVIVSLLDIILRNQFIQHRGECYQAFGIATGLPPGVFLANMYVNKVDELAVSKHAHNIAFYARLVDDSIVCSNDVDGTQRTQTPGDLS